LPLVEEARRKKYNGYKEGQLGMGQRMQPEADEAVY